MSIARPRAHFLLISVIKMPDTHLSGICCQFSEGQHDVRNSIAITMLQPGGRHVLTSERASKVARRIN